MDRPEPDPDRSVRWTSWPGRGGGAGVGISGSPLRPRRSTTASARRINWAAPPGEGDLHAADRDHQPERWRREDDHRRQPRRRARAARAARGGDRHGPAGQRVDEPRRRAGPRGALDLFAPHPGRPRGRHPAGHLHAGPLDPALAPRPFGRGARARERDRPRDDPQGRDRRVDPGGGRAHGPRTGGRPPHRQPAEPRAPLGQRAGRLAGGADRRPDRVLRAPGSQQAGGDRPAPCAGA